MIGALRTGILGMSLVAAGAPSHASEEPAGLQPFQMVRSLELVQDRIANGDQAAMPMQRKLLELADKRIRAMSDAEFADPLNRRALLVYAMSGGNPATVDLTLARLDKQDPDRKLGVGILFYLQGQPVMAQKSFAPIDPMAYTPELGAYVALVKGSVLSNDQATAAIKVLDQARLLAPGTLVEEAALRRTLTLAATLQDPRRFMLGSAQYVRAFIRSPYASQFADAFVAGVIALHDRLDLGELDRITALMDHERAKVIYLRIARRAAIDGLTELAAFASSKAEEHDNDPRALLYASLSAVTSDTIQDLIERLGKIDRAKLSAKDQQLLDAANAVASEMAAVPKAPPLPAAVAPSEAPEMAAISPAPFADGAKSAEPAPRPTAQGAPTAMPAGEEASGPLPVEGAGADASQHVSAWVPDQAPPAPSPALDGHGSAPDADGFARAPAAADPTAEQTAAMLIDARKKLDEIDQLLGTPSK